MKFVPWVLPFLLTVSAVPASADTLTDLLPPDTKVVFGIRVHNLALSWLAQTFAAQAQAMASGWLKSLPLDGVDFLRDIDEVLVAMPGKGENPPAILVVTGRFQVPRLAEGAKLYRNVPVVAGKGAGDAAVALLDSATLLIGDPALVRAAIDQRGGGGNRIAAELNDRITSLRQRYDIWGLGEQPEGFTVPLPEIKVVESIDRFQFGMQLASGLELGAEIHARSPEDGEKLRTALGTVAAMIKGQTPASAAKFDVQADGNGLKLDVFIPDAELKKTIEAQTAVLSPVSIAAGAAPDPQESGPNAALDGLSAPVPGPPPPPTPTATAAGSKPTDAQRDTVVLTLPGKK